MIRFNLFHDWKYNSWLFTGVLLACFVFSVLMRYQQFETWEKSPSFYFVGERPLMTTLDAPYWLRWAREYNNGTYGKDSLRDYPHNSAQFKLTLTSPEFTDHTIFPSYSKIPEIQYRDVPLLSFLIAHLSQFFNYNYYLTGTLIIPVLASLFILPLGIYFFKIGVPAPGLFGGLVGTFSGGYYMRSSIGRIDTDMLNLFFPVMAGLLILLASKAKSDRSVLFYSMCCGLTLFFFQWWYEKSGFVLIFFSVFVFCLFINQIRFRIILLSSFLFLLCVHSNSFIGSTSSFLDFFERYIFFNKSDFSTVNEEVTIPSNFPDVITTISEAERLLMGEVFQRILSIPMFAWVGLLVFFVLFLFRWRVLIPLAPILVLGLLSFYSSNRFVMYLAPFIGIGLGWILSVVIENIFLYLPLSYRGNTKKEFIKTKSLEGDKLESIQKDFKLQSSKWWGGLRQVALYLGLGFFFWEISKQTAISFVPGPSINPRVYAMFMEVKKLVPKDSVLLTWWDYGYAITDATELATFHDGGNQQSPKTYFIARSFTSPDQDELYDITQYLATEGNIGIAKNNISPEVLLMNVRNPKKKPWHPIFLFFTADMTGKYGAISRLGSWDIEKGGSKPRAYQNLACNKITNQEMSCRGAKIDLKAGFINNQLALRRLIFIRNGQVLREQGFGHSQGFTLQLIVVGKNIVEVQLIDEAVFSSNYNQMFLLGRYRKDLFEEVHNALPFSRLYRIKY